MTTMKMLASRVLMGIVAAVVTMMTLTSCSEYDNPAPINPDVEKIIGWWYAEYNQKGAFSEEEQDAYYKVVQGACFNEDGSGLWVEVYLNTAEEIVMPTNRIGSFAAQFDYTIAPDGTVNFDITDLKPIDISDLNPDKWSMKFTGSQIIGKEAGTNFTLKPITEDQQDKLSEWMTWLIGGEETNFDPQYNINTDVDVRKDNVFDRTNWYTSQRIICHVTSGVDNTIKDKYGRIGYRSIILPWAKDKNNNDLSSESNLPEGFCDDLTPGNGWYLVTNFCGRYDFVNANYIALYNKYTGILRYFYYLPDDTKLNGAKDHNWEILMGDGAAEHSPFHYALPMDKKLKASDGEKLNIRNSDYWSQFTTPWTVTQNKFGEMQPMSGWYAFDVDLSVYRGKGNTMMNDRSIKPMLRGYSTENVDLYGSIDSDISGDLELKKCCVNSTGGVFGPLEDVLENVKGVKDFISGASEVYKNVMSGDILGAIEGGINVAKQGCDLVGIDYGKKDEGFDGYKGTVNMKLNGTIDMKGAITSSAVIQGPAQIKQSISEFEFTESHLGEGVWNLKYTPVVYYTNAQIQWRDEYAKKGKEIYEAYWVKGQSPFKACKKVVYDYHSYTPTDPVADTSKDPWCGYVAYFDPSSIQVELNGSVFTQDEIESAQVYATCGVRKVTSAFGSLDKYREVYELKGSKFDINKANGGEYYNRPFNEAPFDALSNSTDKHGLKTGATFKASLYDGHNCGMFGLGDDNYILEPQPLSGDDHPLCTYMPSYEVTVTVIVMHNNKPIIYSRTYLPEYVEMKVDDMPAPKDMEKKKPTHYSTAVYADQMKHYSDVYNWTRRTLQGVEGSRLYYDNYLKIYFDLFEEAWPRLIDGNPRTKWRSTQKARSAYTIFDKQRYNWYAIFKTNYGVSPTGYTLTTGDDNTMGNGIRRPRIWNLYGKKNESDEWTLLDERSTAAAGGIPTQDALPMTNLTPKSYKFNKANPQNYRFFALEIYNIWDDDDWTHMDLAEFQFDYDD